MCIRDRNISAPVSEITTIYIVGVICASGAILISPVSVYRKEEIRTASYNVYGLSLIHI